MVVVLVDLNVVDLGEGGPSVCSGRDGLSQRLAVASGPGCALTSSHKGGGSPPTSPQAWPTAVWGKTLRPIARRLSSACWPGLEPPLARRRAGLPGDSTAA